MPLAGSVEAAVEFCISYRITLVSVEGAYEREASRTPAEAWATLHANAHGPASKRAEISESWPLLGPDELNSLVVVARAFEVALLHEFFNPMLEAVGKTALGAHASDAAQERLSLAIERLYVGSGRMGTMQRVMNATRGFLTGRVIYKLRDIVLATALVRAGGKALGSAFLVGPDLVLTCHHVACDANGKLMPDLEFHFYALDRPFDNAPEIARPASLIASSPPFGTYPKTPWVLNADADNALDYALIKLNRRMGDRPPVQLADSDYQDDVPRSAFLFGFPGGNEMKVDVSTGVQPQQPGSRFLHDLNSVGGMSGGPFLGSSAKVIGLHEAGFEADELCPDAGKPDHKGWTKGANRAIELPAIVRGIREKTKPKDPFSPKLAFTEPAIYSPELRKAWAVHGRNLVETLGLDEATRVSLRREWKELVESIGDPDPWSERLPDDSLHPVFRREDVSNWLSNALRPSGLEQVLIVKASRPGRSRGHSFLSELCATRMKDPERNLLKLGWAGTASGSWRVRVGQADVLRPAAGALSLDEANELIHGHRSRMDALPSNDEPAVAAIDLGGMSDTDALLCEEWETLAVRLACSGYKVLLIDLPLTRVDGLTAALGKSDIQPESGCKVIDSLDHVTWQNVEDWLRMHDGKNAWLKEARDRLRRHWEAPERLHRRFPSFATIEAVWLGLARERLRSDA